MTVDPNISAPPLSRRDEFGLDGPNAQQFVNLSLGLNDPPDNSFLATFGSTPIWRTPATATDLTNTATFTNTTYAKLASLGGTPLPANVEVTVTTGDLALVMISGMLQNNTAGAIVNLTYSVSGASTVAAANGNGIWYEASAANDRIQMGGSVLQAVTVGSNTFTLEGKVTSGTGTLDDVRIIVIPF